MRKAVRKFISRIISLVFVVCISCTIRVPDIQVSSETKVLEDQLLGRYEKLQQESLIFQEHSASFSGMLPHVHSEEEIVRALRARSRLREQIDEYKRRGILGEQNRGMLVVLHPEKMEDDSLTQAIVHQIVKEENTQRRILMNVLFAMKSGLNDSLKVQLESAFAKMNYKDSVPGTWIQSEDGRWEKKKK